MSLEELVESVSTVTGAQSCRQRIPNFRRCDREATSAWICALL